MQPNTAQLFAARFNAINIQVPFKQEWNNGTGYLDALVREDFPELPMGEAVKTVTPGEDGRRVIVMKTVFGNIVVFDRFTRNAESEDPVFVSNAPNELTQMGLVINGKIRDDHMQRLVGDAKYPALYKMLSQDLVNFFKSYDKVKFSFTKA